MNDVLLDRNIALNILQKISRSAKTTAVEEILQPAEMAYKNKLDYVDTLVRSHPSATDKTLVKLIQSYFSCCLNTADKLLNDTKFFHGSQLKAQKNYEKRKLTLVLQEAIEDTKKVMEANKYKDPYIQLEGSKTLAKLTEVLDKLNQYNVEENELNIGNEITVVYKFSTDPKILPEMDEESIAKIDAKVDRIIKNKLRRDDIEDVDYVEVKK